VTGSVGAAGAVFVRRACRTVHAGSALARELSLDLKESKAPGWRELAHAGRRELMVAHPPRVAAAFSPTRLSQDPDSSPPGPHPGLMTSILAEARQ
jgi:hypothetical protein